MTRLFSLVAISIFVLSCSVNKAVYVGPPKIGIKFYILTENKEANSIFNEGRIFEILKNLEKYFRDKSGNKIIHFEFSGLSPYKSLQKSDCTLLKYGTHFEKPNKTQMIGSYLSCKDSILRSSKSINFYIFDSPWQENEKWKTSYAYFDGNTSPAILVNWQTLNSGYKAPDIHETGHVFGLEHTKACGSDDETPTYAMASPTMGCKGTGGSRTLGFTPEEIGIIQKTAVKVKNALFQ